MKRIAPSGFTLVEMLVSIAILGVIAVAVIPSLASDGPQRLGVAAEESANMLRLALSEAGRTGGYVLVDGRTIPGQFSLHYSDASASSVTAIKDPLTKSAAILDASNSAFSQGVVLEPQFKAGGAPWTQLLIGPGLAQLQAFDGFTVNRGVLQPDSGVLLNYGGQSVTVSINETTGLVSLP